MSDGREVLCRILLSVSVCLLIDFFVVKNMKSNVMEGRMAVEWLPLLYILFESRRMNASALSHG